MATALAETETVDVAEAVLDLIETYMADDVRRTVSVCGCAEGGKGSIRILGRGNGRAETGENGRAKIGWTKR